MTWPTSNKLALGGLAVSVAALIISGVAIQPELDHWINDPSAAISSPENNTRVTQGIVAVSGNAGGRIPSDDDLWLVVRPEDDHNFFPMERILRQDDGRWSVPDNHVLLPRPDHYQIFVYLTDGGSSSELGRWLESSKKNQDLPGLAQMPNGAQVLSSVEVDRIR